jgi:probable phosphomutase (TIGR03848 family)
MAYILLIRHGQNNWVQKKRLAGWTPEVHLNEDGQRQVTDLGQRLAHLPINTVYSSPLERCLETAEAVAQPHNLAVTALAEVGEVRYGQWEGAKISKLARRKEWHTVQHFPSRFRFPEGESFNEVQHRAVTALELLSQKHHKEVIAVVSHADVIKLVVAHYLGMHIDQFQRIGISPASVSVLALMPGGNVRVLRINDHGPIQAPPPSTGKNDKETKKKKKAKSKKEHRTGPPERHGEPEPSLEYTETASPPQQITEKDVP